MYRVLLIMVFFLYGLAAHADSNLEKIRASVEEETASLDAINLRLKDLDGKIADVKQQIEQFRKREANLGGELIAITKEKEQLDEDLLAGRKRVERVKQLLRDRVRSLYMNRESSLANQLSLAAERPGFVRTAYYLKHVRHFDDSLVADLQNAQEEIKEKQEELGKLIENQDLIKDLLVKQRKEVEKELVRQKKLEIGLEKEKTSLEPVLTSLRAQALRLETVMLSYANSSVTRQAPRQVLDRATAPARLPEYEGKGLANLKGRLVLPVNRKLKRGFGKYKVNGFKDMVLSKGIEFVEGAKEHVRAIAPGQVLFVGNLPGYDQVVIVN
ncbi:MAG: hypothetical protein KDD62_11715, partial [Bdellovibrionales bacterium]|nr:hypothetical protein [Bdellovibrionales bacterium]